MKRHIALLSVFCLFSLFGHRHFVLISSPGSGKGTFAQYMAKRYGYVHVAPGDIFRSEISAQTPLGKKIQPLVEMGEYVDRKIVRTLVLERLEHIIAQNKYAIIDGFPRSKESLDDLCLFFKEKDITPEVYFLQFLASDETCVNRMIGRIICPNCCNIYNNSFALPKTKGICDRCGSTLIGRKADTKEIAQKRIASFHQQAEPILEYAQMWYPVIRIDTECAFELLQETYDQLACEA